MPTRSWMAVAGLVGLVATVGVCLTARAEEPPKAIVNHVTIELKIDGLGKDGCEILIKPGHPACKFRQRLIKVKPDDNKEDIKTDTMVVQTTAAGRDCMFDITITEPGRIEKSYHRGIRLSPRVKGQPVPVKSPTFYLTAPSVAAKNVEKKTKR